LDSRPHSSLVSLALDSFSPGEALGAAAPQQLRGKSEFSSRNDTGQKESGSDTRNPGAHCQRRLAAILEFEVLFAVDIGKIL